MDRKSMLLIIAPFIALILPLSASFLMTFKAALSPAERDHLIFSPESIKIIERQPVSLPAVIKNPIEIPAGIKKKDFPPGELETMASKPSAQERKVSFILINAGKKMAIIDGAVLREGNNAGGARIVRIEADRVLIKEEGKEEKWLKME